MSNSNYYYRNTIKRVLDFILALVSLAVLAPIMLVIAVLVRKKLGKPIIFCQKRPGLNEKIFKLYKYRTMNDRCDKEGNLLPDKQRQTKFGNFLRATSLDELPELFNILKGEMSIVGPRPLLVRYLPYYTDKERIRHTVRPGLTGLAQVMGRNNLDWNERLAKDVEYVDNLSFIGDIKIVLLTVIRVFKHQDIVTVGEFQMKDLDQERKK